MWLHSLISKDPRFLSLGQWVQILSRALRSSTNFCSLPAHQLSYVNNRTAAVYWLSGAECLRAMKSQVHDQEVIGLKPRQVEVWECRPLIKVGLEQKLNRIKPEQSRNVSPKSNLSSKGSELILS